MGGLVEKGEEKQTGDWTENGIQEETEAKQIIRQGKKDRLLKRPRRDTPSAPSRRNLVIWPGKRLGHARVVALCAVATHTRVAAVKHGRVYGVVGVAVVVHVLFQSAIMHTPRTPTLWQTQRVGEGKLTG